MMNKICQLVPSLHECVLLAISYDLYVFHPSKVWSSVGRVQNKICYDFIYFVVVVVVVFYHKI